MLPICLASNHKDCLKNVAACVCDHVHEPSRHQHMSTSADEANTARLAESIVMFSTAAARVNTTEPSDDEPVRFAIVNDGNSAPGSVNVTLSSTARSLLVHRHRGGKQRAV